MNSDPLIAFDPDLATIWAKDPQSAIDLAKLYHTDPESYAICLGKEPIKEDCEEKPRNPEYTGSYNEIHIGQYNLNGIPQYSGSDYGSNYPVGLCLSTQRGYNVFSDCCCHFVYAIEDYDINYPNPRGAYYCKGHSLGLTCWDILQFFTSDIGDMSGVSLNGIHPNVTKDGYLIYDREVSTPSRFKLADQLNSEPATQLPVDICDQYHTKMNILKHWVNQSLPELPKTEKLTKIECKGRYSGVSFPSNIISFLNLEPQSETILPRTIWNLVFSDIQMVPSRVLENIGLIFNLTFETIEVVIQMDLQLKDWINPQFRVIDPAQLVQVKVTSQPIT
jgi:hypothetical protein